MTLAAVDIPTRKAPAAAAITPLLTQYTDRPLSVFAHHGARCCASARAWFLATDEALRAGAPLQTGPRWIRARWTWGPSRWPMHWCEAVEQSRLDCGALAWMSCEAFRARGLDARLAHVLVRYDDTAVAHWREAWNEADASVHWLGRTDMVYHEVCAVVTDGAVRLWDASAGSWLESRAGSGYGDVAALRVLGERGESLQWAGHSFASGEWAVLPT